MKKITIFNEDLIILFGTNIITSDVLSKKNSFSFELPLNERSLSMLKELNKLTEGFSGIKCGITFYSQKSTSNTFQKKDRFMYYSALNNNSLAITFALQNTSPFFSQINIDSAFYNLDLPKDLMQKFSNLEILSIKGLANYSHCGTIFIPPCVKSLKLYDIHKIINLDISQIENPSDLILFLNQEFLLNGQNNALYGIENLDLTDNPTDQLFNLNSLQQRFPNLKKLKMNPNYKFLGPLSTKEISFLVKVAGQIKIETTYDNLVEFFLNDYIPFNIYGIKKIGNIFYDPTKVKLKPIEITYKRYKRISNKSKFKNAFVKINIKNMSELSTEEAIKLKEQAPNCQIAVREVCSNLSVYSLDDYILMSKNLDKILSGINPNSSELEQYSHIYKAMYSIFYNYAAIDCYNPEFVKTHPYNNFFASCLYYSSRNLYGALKYNSAVCAGFASAIHNACARQGIKSKIVPGIFYDFVDLSILQNYDKEFHHYTILKCFDSFHYLIRDHETRHAWNLIKINGIWYNSDSTWDVTRIRKGYLPKYFLFSDDENIQRGCERDNDYYSSIKCNTPFSSYKLAETFPNLQPEPPRRMFTLSQNQFNILKKVLSDYTNPLKIMSAIYEEFSAFRMYKKATAIYPIPLNPSSNQPDENYRKTLAIPVVKSPRGIAFTDTSVYPKESKDDKEPEI